MSQRETCVDRDLHPRDEAWFEELFRSEYASLCRFAMRYVDHGHVAEELVQDCFLRLWARRNEPSAGAMRSYLYRAVRNACFDYIKSRKVRRQVSSVPDLDDRPDDTSPETDLRQLEISEAVDAAIDLLPERRREIFTLSRRDGLTYAEIADVLAISVKTVETQMGRSLRFLRNHLRYLLVLVLFL